MEADEQIEELKEQLYSPLVPRVISYSPVCLFRHRMSVCLSLFCSSCASFSFSPARESFLTTVLTHSLHFLLSKTAKALSHCLVQLLFLPTRIRKQKKNQVRLKLKFLHVNQIAGSCSQGESVILQE